MSYDNEKIDLSSLKYKSKDEPIVKPEKKEKQTDKQQEKKEKQEVNDFEKLMTKPSKIKQTKKDKSTEDEIIQKRKMILLMQFYLVEFSERLKTFKKINLEKKTYDELLDIKKEMDFVLSNKSNVQQGTAMISTVIQTLEYLTLSYTPVKCEGLSKICDDPETIDIMKLICLKHISLVQIEPEQQLIYKIVSSMLMLHNVNTYKESLTVVVNDNINEINNKYSDI